MAPEGAFGDLRRLAEGFAAVAIATSTAAPRGLLIRLARKLGTTAVPLLVRELAHPDTRRREAARETLAVIAADPAAAPRPRVIAALRALTTADVTDETKVCALGLLSELGERAEVRFTDPQAIQRRSAVALASQLHTPHDVANAVDLMVRQLSGDDIAQMIDILVASAPAVARRVGAELAARLDLAETVRERIADVFTAAAAALPAEDSPARRAARATQTAVLVDAAARLVVIASRKLPGERRWRRWAVLVGAHGRIEDCLYEEEPTDAAPLIASLCADGYRVASTELGDARAAVAAAARASAADPAALDSSYYLGRDLLELADAHLPRPLPGGAAARDLVATTIDRALVLLASADPADRERADALLAKLADTAPKNRRLPPDLDAARAACALALGRPADAAQLLARAISAEPAWPLHHWNLGVALHQLGDAAGAYQAFRRFLATSAQPTGLLADPDQPARLALAERTAALLERTARLHGVSLTARRRRSRRSKKA